MTQGKTGRAGHTLTYASSLRTIVSCLNICKKLFWVLFENVHTRNKMLNGNDN